MNTHEYTIPDLALGGARRCIRGIIGGVAIAAILLLPGLNEAWLFLLAMIGAYESLTAILDADLIYGVLYLMISGVRGANRREASGDMTKSATISSPLITTHYGEQEYQAVG